MIARDRAIVLRYAPFSNTSRLVTWLTEHHGRVVTSIKGSQRPKSFFLGQYDLFYTCELLFYERETQQVHAAKECSPLATRDWLRADWRAAASASYGADLLARCTPLDTPLPGAFALMERFLDALQKPPSDAALLLWFELRLLDFMGLRPRLDQCMDCGRPLPEPGRFALLVPGRGGMVCKPCAGARGEPGRPVTPGVLAILLAWQQADRMEPVWRTRCAPAQLGEMAGLLGNFIEHHLDLQPASRVIALDLLRA